MTDRKYKVEIFYRTKNAVSQDQESKGALSIWSTMTSYDTAPISLIPTTLLESRSTPHTCRSSEQPSLDPKIGRALASSSSKILPRCGFVRIRLASLASSSAWTQDKTCRCMQAATEPGNRIQHHPPRYARLRIRVQPPHRFLTIHPRLRPAPPILHVELGSDSAM